MENLRMGILEELELPNNATPRDKFDSWLEEKADKTQYNYKLFIGELEKFFGKDLNQIVEFHKQNCLKKGWTGFTEGFLSIFRVFNV